MVTLSLATAGLSVAVAVGWTAGRAAGAVERRALSDQATRDPLTGLPNRRALTAAAAAATRQRGGRVGLALVDLDGFKRVNDTLGHDAGDVLLAAVAARLAAAAGPAETLARLGGDEFALLLPGLVDDAAGAVDQAHRRARALVDALADPFDLIGRQVAIGASVGLATIPAGAGELRQLLTAADQALYRAKAAPDRIAQAGVPRADVA